MIAYTLGLDIGANSIGWAVIDEPATRLLDAGVRVFPAGVDNFDTKKERSKSEDRRIARGMRRQTARRARRKRELKRALVDAGLYPGDAVEQALLECVDPYDLRRRGLDERLHLHEFGRALMHLSKRRGFLSNRKSDCAEDAEAKGMLAKINELAAAIQSAGCRTLGEYCSRERSAEPLVRLRGKHTRRDMFEHEFELLWAAQRQHYPDTLTDSLKYGSLGKRSAVRAPVAKQPGADLLSQFGLHGLIFFQRSMYWPKSVVGACELEPKRKRCPRADRMAQRFRLLQDVNNLRFLDPRTRQEERLSNRQRTLLLDKLSKVKQMTFDQIRKALGFVENAAFNLERGKRTKLLGMGVDATLADKKFFGAAWHKRNDAERDRIVRALVHADENEVRRLARDEWGVDEETTERLLAAELPDGYSALSVDAIERLLPHMERGLLYMTSDDTPCALTEAGYLRPDQREHRVAEFLPAPPDVANPVVRRALAELHKVANNIVRRYGKPTYIRIELARNASAGAEQRAAMSQRMRDREKERDRAADKIRELGVKVTRAAIDRHLLWEEQGGVCIYSGKCISAAQLFGAEAQIDHILPLSRTLDDSFANKVVCLVKPNAEKGKQTPFEWLAGRDADRFDQVCQRASSLPYPKRRRFSQKELDLDGFIERQLNDTRYINRLARQYLQCLVPAPHHVLCPKGIHTERLRHQWGLNTILRDDEISRKNRTDHRHHAIDAVVIALTDHSRLQKFAEAARDDLLGTAAVATSEPWQGFRSDVEGRVLAINVSHRVRRKIAGALHEDTLYGPTRREREFVVRKPLDALTPSMISDIRDPVVRKLVLARLEEHGITPGRGSKDRIPTDVWKDPLVLTSEKESRRSSRPAVIKKVRLLRREKTIQSIRGGSAFVKPGSVHHLCLFEWEENGKTVRDAEFVSMIDAVQRVQRHEPVIQRAHPRRPDALFLMSLSAGESVLIPIDGVERLFVFDTAASTSKQMWFRLHTAGGRSSDKTNVVSKKPSSFEGRKVTVTPLGEIRWAND